MLEQTFPQEWYVTEQIKRHANLTHSGSMFNSVENAHYFPFYIRYKFKELPVHVRAYTLMQVKFL